MYNARTNRGFLIRDANENGSGNEQQFHSLEKGENIPQLVISFAPAPTTPTPTPTATPVPPTATARPEPPTATPTDTPEPSPTP
jgi:hypothetical protein